MYLLDLVEGIQLFKSLMWNAFRSI
ncbi:conserved hypothetical protein [Clostridioides difficile T14]|nr:conserved hypothetical protein [Clostridioides difficile E12]CCL91473.1 conserved hypothetical protein [Clostridioides difficile T14]